LVPIFQLTFLVHSYSLPFFQNYCKTMDETAAAADSATKDKCSHPADYPRTIQLHQSQLMPTKTSKKIQKQSTAYQCMMHIWH